jgi:hypothetical protein
MFARFSIHQLNAPSSCCYLSKVLLLSLKSFVAEKRHGAMQKLLKKVKKKKKRVQEKWTSVRDI